MQRLVVITFDFVSLIDEKSYLLASGGDINAIKNTIEDFSKQIEVRIYHVLLLIPSVNIKLIRLFSNQIAVFQETQLKEF